ncbi:MULTISPECIES: hypothetical protein [Streptomyces]|uniref:Uncharacterized protein n=1 Tax=Streptomyces lycii TaxID=2654337 RepID=A0ABQ7FDL9_9ACTN|nr:hypothetical protein [Streptomyces lycii]KAF4406920.1 hypothetical protein GCU69_22385 [Streptomyces lycii]
MPNATPDRPPLPVRAKPRKPPAPKLREATAARDALAAALTGAGIQLPVMDVRTPWGDFLPDTPERPWPRQTAPDGDRGCEPAPADGRTPDSARYALVHLGVCSPPVALALAAVIARGAAR